MEQLFLWLFFPLLICDFHKTHWNIPSLRKPSVSTAISVFNYNKWLVKILREAFALTYYDMLPVHYLGNDEPFHKPSIWTKLVDVTLH